jgi:NADPH:quinone reductase-like Zn-dependent oxidoreductase
MRAAVLERFGEAAAIHPGEAPDPVERVGWTVVRLRAAALNWHDVLVRQGRYGSPLPHVAGADGAGIATDSGEEVVILPSLFWGDDESAPGAEWEILGDHRPGTYAEYVSVPNGCLLPKPIGLDWHQAAGLPLVGVTVYRALVSRGGLRAGESVLISGAGGGVAPMAVAVAAGVGARVVVTSSSEAKVARAVAHGASGGVLYTDPGWPEQATKQTAGGRGFDVVLDTVGTWAESLRALRPGGRLVVLGASRAETATVDARPFYFGQYSILGTTMGSAADFRGLLGLLESGAIDPPSIDSVFPLSETAAAHQRLEVGDAFGKIILDIDTVGAPA